MGTQDSAMADHFNVWLSNDPAAPPSRIVYQPPTLFTASQQVAVTGTGAYDPISGQGAMVALPADSNMRGAGAGGADVGANVTCLYDHGTNTKQPMWNALDGRFAGCDWYAPGSADDIAAAEGYVEHCSTTNELVNVIGAGPPCSAP
jgi:hypothetical protein